jgi:type IV pilus assembly protein PilV
MKISQGFTLIEVLISTLILSVGLLGITGMQLTALSYNRNALLRIEASQLTVDLVDRIDASTSSTYGPIAMGDEPALVTDCSLDDCSPTELEAYDVAQWLCSISSVDAEGATYESCTNLGITGSLPSGQASIQTLDDEYAITVQWADVRTNTTTSVQLFMRVPQ